MEEILASIRRIIADDDASKSAQRVAEPPKPVAPPPRAAPPPPPPAPPEPSFPEMAEIPAAAAGDPAEDDAGDQTVDILDLTESMAAPMPLQSEPDLEPISEPSAVPQFRTIDGGSDVGFDDAPEPVIAPPPVEVERGDDDRSRLLSSQTTAAVDSAFNTLAHTVLVQNARTLEDLVREMLRPMLKSWLDDNLPRLVERLVRAEIERVSRGRSG
jgi:uncharacterized protein